MPGEDRVEADLLCFSHLRWDFVFQRPQHLLSRAVRTRRVLYWEEPVFGDRGPSVDVMRSSEDVLVARPYLPWGLSAEAVTRALRQLLDETLAGPVEVLWYYTPMALAFSGHVRAQRVVYDCMDELAAFDGADPTLPACEARLMARADLVFTGGASLYAAKRGLHPSVHAFPSGVDLAHFRPAREPGPEPVDQASIGHPRVGFFGVIDERLDRALLAEAAASRPDLEFVLIGPTAKLDPEALPQAANLHYLGPKDYAALPSYIGHWDVAMMPFAINASTRFISPTKTPEYLAGGRPVAATPVPDVVSSWGDADYVAIAGDAPGFVAAIDRLLALPAGWQTEADGRLAPMSWDGIWARMEALIARRARPAPPCSDYLVVGAGFAGSVLAERLAAGSGKSVLVIDRRPHVGGNAHDRLDAAGVLIHPYGPHIFHTNAPSVLAYLSRFTAWRPYEHRVLAEIGGRLLPLPINRTTVNGFFGTDLREDEVADFLRARARPVAQPRTSEDIVLGTVGPELYAAVFRDYTRKQWGLDPAALDKSVAGRLAPRTNDDDRYFTDQHQCMPLHGYTKMFEAMLDHPNIEVSTETEFAAVDPSRYRQVIYTGPIDEYFGYRFGKLPYRSLQFRHETHRERQRQPVAVINHPSADVPYTRVTEFKHITGQEHPMTSLCYEMPSAEGDPYYPIPREENAALYRRYRALADATPDVTFVGRLATYQYLNMDQVVAQALAVYTRMSETVRRTVAAE